MVGVSAISVQLCPKKPTSNDGGMKCNPCIIIENDEAGIGNRGDDYYICEIVLHGVKRTVTVT